MLEPHSQSTPQDVRYGEQAQEALSLASQLQAELDELREELAWSSRLAQLGMLTAVLAHELNNQITPICSYAQLALANPDKTELTTKALNAAVAHSEKACGLIERVLDLATPNPSKQERACFIPDIVDNALACMQPTAQQVGVNLIARVRPGAAAMDSLALEQVLINLVANACQAMSSTVGQRQIEIQSHESNKRLILTVADTGPGIPRLIRETLFEPFVTSPSHPSETSTVEQAQSQPNPSSKRQGTGLGLSICKQLVVEAGGQITLSTSTSAGTTFRIDLPTA